MAGAEQSTVVVWAHGFGAHQTGDRLGRRVEGVLGSEGYTVVRPHLSTLSEDGKVVTPFPLDEQAAAIAEAAQQVHEDGAAVLIAAHSQGSLPAAQAVGRLEFPPSVAFFAAPLSGFEWRLGAFMELEGGRIERHSSPSRTILPDVQMTPEYWDSFRKVNPIDLVASGIQLAAHHKAYYLVAGNDRYLGPQTEEIEALRRKAPNASYEVMVGADHDFSAHHAEQLARRLAAIAAGTRRS